MAFTFPTRLDHPSIRTLWAPRVIYEPGNPKQRLPLYPNSTVDREEHAQYAYRRDLVNVLRATTSRFVFDYQAEAASIDADEEEHEAQFDRVKNHGYAHLVPEGKSMNQEAEADDEAIIEEARAANAAAQRANEAAAQVQAQEASELEPPGASLVGENSEMQVEGGEEAGAEQAEGEAVPANTQGRRRSSAPTSTGSSTVEVTASRASGGTAARRVVRRQRRIPLPVSGTEEQDEADLEEMAQNSNVHIGYSRGGPRRNARESSPPSADEESIAMDDEEEDEDDGQTRRRRRGRGGRVARGASARGARRGARSSTSTAGARVATTSATVSASTPHAQRPQGRRSSGSSYQPYASTSSAGGLPRRPPGSVDATTSVHMLPRASGSSSRYSGGGGSGGGAGSAAFPPPLNFSTSSSSTGPSVSTRSIAMRRSGSSTSGVTPGLLPSGQVTRPIAPVHGGRDLDADIPEAEERSYGMASSSYTASQYLDTSQQDMSQDQSQSQREAEERSRRSATSVPGFKEDGEESDLSDLEEAEQHGNATREAGWEESVDMDMSG